MSIYKKMLKYTTQGALFKFLCLVEKFNPGTKTQLFFEVSLGNRIADSVLLASYGETKYCFILEFKTCNSKAPDMMTEVRRSQRLQGLQQLSDSVKYIQACAPPGPHPWQICPYLIFKSQKNLKTIHSEKLPIVTNVLHTNDDKLVSFLIYREDVKIKKRLSSLPQNKKLAQNHKFLGTTPRKPDFPGQIPNKGSEKTCPSTQKTHFKCQRSNNKKRIDKSRVGHVGKRSTKSLGRN